MNDKHSLVELDGAEKEIAILALFRIFSSILRMLLAVVFSDARLANWVENNLVSSWTGAIGEFARVDYHSTQPSIIAAKAIVFGRRDARI